MSGDSVRGKGWGHVRENVEEVPGRVARASGPDVAEVRGDQESEWAAMTRVTELLGVGTPETVRKWCRQDQVDAGCRPGVTTEDSVEGEATSAGERRAQACQCHLEGGVGFFRGRTRPATSLIVAFTDTHVGDRHEDADGHGLRWGVESICEQLTERGCKIAPASYYEHRSRTLSAQELRDAEPRPKVTVSHHELRRRRRTEGLAHAEP